MSELYRDYIEGKADEIINSLGGTITPAPANAELYRDFLDRKFDDVINAVDDLVKIRSLNYKGTGGLPTIISFPVKPKLVLGIFSSDYVSTNSRYKILPFNVDSLCAISIYSNPDPSVNDPLRTCNLTYDDNTNELTITSQFETYGMNVNNFNYIVYYI